MNREQYNEYRSALRRALRYHKGRVAVIEAKLARFIEAPVPLKLGSELLPKRQWPLMLAYPVKGN